MPATIPRQPSPRLRTVLERIGQRQGSTPPTREAITEAVRIIEERDGNKGGISLHVSAGTVYEIEDGADHQLVVLFVHDYGSGPEISHGLCSCFDSSVCPHMLAVLAGLSVPPLKL